MKSERTKLTLKRFTAVAAVLFIWQVVSLFSSPLIVPSVPRTALAIVDIVRSDNFLRLLGMTVGRLAMGLVIGVAIGTGLGLLFGLNKKISAVFIPFNQVLMTIPPVCWVVLALVWFGLNGKPSIFIVAISTVPVMVINLVQGVSEVDPELLQMAQLYGFGRKKTLRYVVLPSIRPYFSSALEIVIGSGWKLVVMGEVLTTNTGIGGAITDARLNVEPEKIIGWAVILVCLSLIVEKLLGKFVFAAMQPKMSENPEVRDA